LKERLVTVADIIVLHETVVLTFILFHEFHEFLFIAMEFVYFCSLNKCLNVEVPRYHDID